MLNPAFGTCDDFFVSIFNESGFRSGNLRKVTGNLNVNEGQQEVDLSSCRWRCQQSGCVFELLPCISSFANLAAAIPKLPVAKALVKILGENPL